MMRRAFRAAWIVSSALALAACGDDSAGSGSATVPQAAPSIAPEAGAAPTTTPAGAPATGTIADLAPGALISDAWYDVREDGRKNGWYHMTWTRSTFDGKPSIHDHTVNFSSSTRVMAGIEDVFESETVTDLERSEDGMLLSVSSKSTIADRVETSETRWEGDRYTWKQTVAGRDERRSVASPTPLPVDTEAYLAPIIRRGELVVGAKLSYGAANYLASRTDTVTLEVEAQEDVVTAAGTARCWRIRERVTGRPGETTWWLDERGVLTKLAQPPLTVERTTESKARRIDPAAAAYSITFPSDPDLPRSTSLDRCVVDVAITRGKDVPLPDFPATPFSKEVSRDGDVIRMELTAHDDATATVTLPVTDAALAKALEATNLYAPESASVRGALRDALSYVPEAERTDGRRVARAVLRWVFKTLRKQSGAIPQPTAPEILDAGMGDCSEHAVLFVAMCRAAGLPARRLSGYAQVGDMWGAHSFCEVWLGRWIGADPTTNELGTRARYVAFGWDEDADSYPGLVSQRVTGRMKIRTVEFTEGGETMTIDAARKRKPLRDDLAGLVFAKPADGWTVNVGPGRGIADVHGPGVSASIQVSAGLGDIDAELLRETQFGTGQTVQFGGHAALRMAGGFLGRGATTYAIPTHRRVILLILRGSKGGPTPASLDELARLLEPSLAE